MKHLFFKTASLGVITLFAVYWCTVVILALPVSGLKKAVSAKATRFNHVFGYSWPLFSPTDTFDQRLYVVLKFDDGRARQDTIELFEEISLLKQQHAPFNEGAKITDYLLHTNMTNLTSLAKLSGDFGNSAGPVKVNITQRENYKRFLASVYNYCLLKIRAMPNHKAVAGFAFYIAHKHIKSFENAGEASFTRKEEKVFEAPFIQMTL